MFRGMFHVSIPLPPDLQSWVKPRVSDGTYSDAADYVRDLAQRDRDQNGRERLRALIEEGLASGVVDQDIDEMFDEILDGLRDRRAEA